MHCEQLGKLFSQGLERYERKSLFKGSYLASDVDFQTQLMVLGWRSKPLVYG